MNRPMVAIVGRPNVGKSTLFNRLIGEKRAIVEDLPGTTRDRIHADTSWKGHEFTLVDSGGLETRPESAIRQKVRDQVGMAIAAADVILFLVDTRDGITTVDEEIAEILRRAQKPIVLVANKVDSIKQQNDIYQFFELNLGEPVPISGYHGKAIDELLEKIITCLPDHLPPTTPVPETMKVAIVGRPNVGKSLLVNTILGEERVIVHDTPGTTRDAVDTVFHYNGETAVLIDTAGIRRSGRIEAGVERYGLLRAKQAIERADIAVLLVDAVEGIAAQDMHILGYVEKAGKGAMLAVNKWDLVEAKDEDAWTEVVRNKAKFMPYIEILFVSAKTGYGVEKILPTAKRIYAERFRLLLAPALKTLINEAVTTHLPPKKGKRKLKIFNAVQTGVNPPAFVFYVNDATLVHFSYRRYMEKRLRQSFGFQGTPLRLAFKNRGENPHGRT